MKKLSLKAKLITGLVTAGVLLSSTGFAFAATNSSGTSSAGNIAQSTLGKHHEKNNADKAASMQNRLKTAVTANIITQTESDKITAYLTAHKANKPAAPKTGVKPDAVKRPDLFANLVTNNILTQAKADALKTFFESQRSAEQKQRLETALKAFITDKTITQDQAAKIINAVTADAASRKAAMDKAASMTETERKAYFESLKTSHVDILKALVTDGTITQSQADKLASVFHRGGKGHHGGRDFNRGKKSTDSAKAPAVTS